MNADNTSPNNNALATAYALGELTAAERAAFEQQMENDPALAALARETKKFCSLLDGTLRDPVPSLAEENRAALLAAAGRRRKPVIWVPWLAGAAAACVAGGYYFKDTLFRSNSQEPVYAGASLDSRRAAEPAGELTSLPSSAKAPGPSPSPAQPTLPVRQASPELLAAVKDLRYADTHIAVALATPPAPLTASPNTAQPLLPPPAMASADTIVGNVISTPPFDSASADSAQKATKQRESAKAPETAPTATTASTVTGGTLDLTPKTSLPYYAGNPVPDINLPANPGGIPADNVQLSEPPPMVPAKPAAMSGEGLLVSGYGGGRGRGAGTGSGGGIGSGWGPGSGPGKKPASAPAREESKSAGFRMKVRAGTERHDFSLTETGYFDQTTPTVPGTAGSDLSKQVEEVEKSRLAMIDLQKKHNINDTVPYSTGQGFSPVVQPGMNAAEQARTYETRLEEDVIKMTAQLKVLDGLKGDQLIAGASELGISNTTIQKLYPEYQTMVSSRASALKSGFGPDHPKIKSLDESIALSYKQLEQAAELFKNNLEVQIGSSKKMLENAKERAADKAVLSETERKNQTEYAEAKQKYEEAATRLEMLKQQAALVEAPGTESYEPIIENPFLKVLKAPLSTFSIDVDTASYSNVRRFLNMGQCPPTDAVRLEELVNYFPYDYAQPVDGKPFAVHVEMTSAPWDETHRIARIALKGKEIAQAERPAANLVFLVDVSGSMQPENKLPLVKQSLKFVVERLTQKDTVSLVTYAGESGVALPATNGADKARIMAAIDGLGAGGSTNGAGGISTAYQQAAQHFNKEGINRVILATDGDFNVGVTSHGDLLKLITEKAKTGVFLSVLGYGMGNTKDDTMELLADKGNGNYAYIDGLSEARKALGEQFTGTLVTIAKDVKIQIEFNPSVIRGYRLLGYENRMLAKEDFKDDKKDAGEIGAGHTVTALYELVPVGAPEPQVMVDDLKYQPKPAEPAPPPPPPAAGPFGRETMTVKLRWKAPDADVSQPMDVPVTDNGAKIEVATSETKWAVAVAGFAAMLNGSQFNGLTWEQIRTLAKAGKGADPNGYRGEFLQLIDRAESVRR